MQQQIEKKLQSMLNRSYMYGMRMVTITGYRFDDVKERVYIHTNEKEDHYDRTEDSVLSFLMQFEETGITKKAESDAPGAVLLAMAKNMGDSLKGVLMDNIEKVQQDPKYIEQATTINNSVNSMISLTKLQLQLYSKAQAMKND